MLIDSQLKFATGEELGNTGTRKVGKAVPLDVRADQGEGYPLYLVVLVSTTATSGGASTLSVELVTADNSALTTNVEVLFATPVFALADIAAGTFLAMIPIPKALYRTHLGIREVVAGANFTGGAITAFLTQDPPAWRAYAEGNN